MAFNGSGVFTPPGTDFPAVSGTLIESTKFNNIVNDVATGLTTAICKDGQTTITANIPLAGYKITGIGAATARTDAASLATIQDGTGVYVATVGGTADAFTLTPSPAITSYAAGQHFVFLAVGTSTTTVTCAVSGLTAKAVQTNGSALSGGEIVSGKLYSIRYDGTQFQLETISVTPYIATLLNDTTAAAARTTLDVPGLAANNTFTGNNTHSGTETFNKEIILGSQTEVGTNHSLQQVGGNTIYHIAPTNSFIFKTTTTGAGGDRFKIYNDGGMIGCDGAGSEASGGPKGNGTINTTGVYDNGNRVYSDSNVPASIPKAWIRFNGTTGTVIASYKMHATTPLTKNTTGDYTVTFLNAFTSSTSFIGVGSASAGSTPSAGTGRVTGVTDYTTTTARISCNDNNSDTNVDADEISYVFYGT